MARKTRSRAEKVADARLLAEHHIVDLRYSKKGREIIAIKHAALGWISPTMYYAMQELHSLIPSVLEGGYRLKQAIWTTEINLEVIASGLTIPLGVLLSAAAGLEAAIDQANGNTIYAAIDLAALALPFGEFWIIYHALELDIGFVKFIWEKLAGVFVSRGSGGGVTLPPFVNPIIPVFEIAFSIWSKILTGP